MSDVDEIRAQLNAPGGYVSPEDIEYLLDLYATTRKALQQAEALWQLNKTARRALFKELADIIQHWDGEETEDYIVAKLTLVQWNESDSNDHDAL